MATTAIPAAYILFVRDDNVLLLRRAGTRYYCGWWALPAGHVEEGETPLQCALREAEEEVGIRLQPEQLQHAISMYQSGADTGRTSNNRLDVFFITREWSGEPTNCEPHKASELAWHPLGALPQDLVHSTRAAIDAWMQGAAYLERTDAELAAHTAAQ